jgi:hypothetical protein
MDDASSLFAIVDRLVDARPLTAAVVGKLVSGELTPVGRDSTEYILVYQTQGAPEFDHVELRLPGPNGAYKGQFLKLEVNAKRCVQVADVRSRYGREHDIDVPTPRQPASDPVYFVYERHWGTLSFGFARDGAQCLRGVAIDFTGAV